MFTWTESTNSCGKLERAIPEYDLKKEEKHSSQIPEIFPEWESVNSAPRV